MTTQQQLTEMQAAPNQTDTDTDAGAMEWWGKNHPPSLTGFISPMFKRHLTVMTKRHPSWESVSQLVRRAVDYYQESDPDTIGEPTDLLAQVKWGPSTSNGTVKISGVVRRDQKARAEALVESEYTDWETQNEYLVCALVAYVNYLPEV